MIYFLKARELLQTCIKIGFTTNIDKRLESLQRASPSELTLLGLLEGNLAREKELHFKFKTHHIRNEWFTSSPEILAFLNEQKHQQAEIKQQTEQDEEKKRIQIWLPPI